MACLLSCCSEVRLRPEPGGQAPEDDSQGVDTEALASGTGEVVFFNGGYYSAGPSYIGRLGTGSSIERLSRTAA